MQAICDNKHVIQSKTFPFPSICPICESQLIRAVWDEQQHRYVKVRPSKRKRT